MVKGISWILGGPGLDRDENLVSYSWRHEGACRFMLLFLGVANNSEPFSGLWPVARRLVGGQSPGIYLYVHMYTPVNR